MPGQEKIMPSQDLFRLSVIRRFQKDIGYFADDDETSFFLLQEGALRSAAIAIISIIIVHVLLNNSMYTHSIHTV